MTTYKLVQNNTAVSNKAKRLREDLEEFRDDFLKAMATKIVLNSPVDTGTYVQAHEIVLGQPRGTGQESSKGKPRNQPYEPNYNAALSSLYADIEALPDEAPLVSIRNNAEHAGAVELVHSPYTIARSAAGEIARSVKQ